MKIKIDWSAGAPPSPEAEALILEQVELFGSGFVCHMPPSWTHFVMTIHAGAGMAVALLYSRAYDEAIVQVGPPTWTQ